MSKSVNMEALVGGFSGQFGTPDKGDHFVTDERTADELVNLGLAKRTGGKVAAEDAKNV